MAQRDDLSHRWYRRRCQALTGQMGYRNVVEDDPGEGPGVSDPPPGVGVDPVDQCGDITNPVPRHPGRGELGGGGDPAPDYQDAVVTAGDVSLDQDPPAAGPGRAAGGDDLLDGGQPDEDVAPVVAGHRLDHDGRAEVGDGIHGLLGAVHDVPLGHGNAVRSEQLLGNLLVGGNV